MPFDNDTRNKLARMVADARTLLVREFTDQLQEAYGIQPNGTITPVEKLTHLDDERRDVAELLRERVDHLASGLSTEKKPVVAAIDRLTREQAFTILNRFAALRMCEERDIVQESVRGGLQSKGFQLYLKTAGAGLGDTYDRYRTFIFCLFDELALDLGVLFDRFAPSGMLFPREPALIELFWVLNQDGLKGIWSEDEAIGWVYQYFNSREEIKKMRDASQAPRNSRELAVRNQFFTPRYVVEFLTDNTLGRTWYEMTQGETRLIGECDYLVRRPNEIFLKEGEEAPEQEAEDETDVSQEELLKQPVYIPYRAVKDPRTILMLDPACGSMHFGLYAFDLYEVIYEEAWDREASATAPATGAAQRADQSQVQSNEGGSGEVETSPGGGRRASPRATPGSAGDCGVRSTGGSAPLPPLRELYLTIEDLRRDVPRLIIEHNIHGIDIDPRCAQIAGLSLWLRAQRSWQKQGIKPVERPRITKSNIVCAEPMPGEKDMLEEFIGKLGKTNEGTVIGQLVEIIWDKMQLAGEAGSLLKIEEELSDAIAEARKMWEILRERRKDVLPGMEDQFGPQQGEFRFDVAGIRRHAFWDDVEQRVLDALRAFAGSAGDGRSYQRRLFADDASQGFAFIDLCRKRYDVVVMNPPFGLGPRPVYELLQKAYEDTYVDLYASFVTNGALRAKGGFVGAITSRSFLTSKKLLRWRENELVAKLSLLVDLGRGVMDSALVDSSAYVLDLSPACGPDFVVLDARRSELTPSWVGQIKTASRLPDFAFVVLRQNIAELPGHRLLYFLPPKIHLLLRGKRRLEPAVATVRGGLRTFEDFRFLRLLWEIPNPWIGRGRLWDVYAKGGEYANYCTDIHLLVKRGNSGAELAAKNQQINGQVAQSRQGESYYYRPGIQYSLRSSKGFSCRAIPRGCVMSHNAPMVISQSRFQPEYLLGWLSSPLIRAMVEMQSAADDYIPGSLKLLPWLAPSAEAESRVIELTRNAIGFRLRWSRHCEPFASFTTRRPMVEVMMYKTGLFEEPAEFRLDAYAQNELVAEAAACPHVNPASGLVQIAPGQAIKVPLKMSEDFEGSFEVRAVDPVTGVNYATLRLKTDYLN